MVGRVPPMVPMPERAEPPLAGRAIPLLEDGRAVPPEEAPITRPGALRTTLLLVAVPAIPALRVTFDLGVVDAVPEDALPALFVAADFVRDLEPRDFADALDAVVLDALDLPALVPLRLEAVE